MKGFAQFCGGENSATVYMVIFVWFYFHEFKRVSHNFVKTKQKTTVYVHGYFRVVLFSQISRVSPRKNFPLEYMAIYCNETSQKSQN